MMEKSVREDLREKLVSLIARIKTNHTNNSDFLPMDAVTFDCDYYWIDLNLPSKSWDLWRAWRRFRVGGLSPPSPISHDPDYYLFKYLNAAGAAKDLRLHLLQRALTSPTARMEATE
jgi:hypothetical protein